MRQRAVLAVLLASAALVAAGCASSSNGGGSPTTPSVASSPAGSTPAGPGPSTSAPPPSTAPPASCTPATMHTHTAGELTVATDSPAYPPWFLDNKPANGKGFESAVAYAVAKQLGYPPDKVTWATATFTSVIAPTPKPFDFDINEVSITAVRAKAVDFSSGYYDVTQAVVTLKNSKYANAKSIADLQGAKLAAEQGTTSLDAINDVIKPGVTPGEFPTNNLAVQALKNAQVDGLVVDLPTAFYVVAAQVPDGKIVGQLAPSANPEQFGLVLDKDSSLTSCVSKAVDALRANGTLARLQQHWLANAGNAPVLK
jgi:polar amino acid transport system substrate-binding protein